ncbi:C4-dicarboxylate transporter/malic acid transport protein, partial [mine drainage metagenome]
MTSNIALIRHPATTIKERNVPRLPDVDVLASPDATSGDVRYLGPNWYASVMGTGIVANAGALLPFDVPGLRVFVEIVWVAAAALLAGLVVATLVHWARSPHVARSYGRDVS